MTTYRIENTASGIILGEFLGSSQADALDSLALTLGYHTAEDMNAAVEGGENLRVTEVSGHCAICGIALPDKAPCAAGSAGHRQMLGYQ